MTVRLIVCLCALLSAASLSGQDGWVNVSDALIKSVPDHKLDIPGARRIGGIAVCRHSGHLFAALNGPPFGLYRSKDAGATWERIDGGKVGGGWVRSYSIQLDQDKPGRMAVFRVGPPAPKSKRGRAAPQSAYTLDGGETWHEIVAISGTFQGWSGMPHGAVDWSNDKPLHLLSQAWVRPQVSLSVDGGKTWKPVGNRRELRALIDYGQRIWWEKEHPGKRPVPDFSGYGLIDNVILIGFRDSIKRTEDNGKTLEKVSDFIVTGITPIAFQDKLYWVTTKGVIMSEDKGKTWALYGSELPNVRKGPFFGKDATTMVVVSDDGVFKTIDSGATWTKISELFVVPDAYRLDYPPVLLRTDYAWDHTRDLLYVAGFAGSAYKKEVK